MDLRYHMCFKTCYQKWMRKCGSQLHYFPIFRNLLVSYWEAIDYYKGHILQVILVIHFDIGSQTMINPRTGSISITWQLFWNANSRAWSQTHWIRKWDWGPSSLFLASFEMILMYAKVLEALYNDAVPFKPQSMTSHLEILLKSSLWSNRLKVGLKNLCF